MHVTVWHFLRVSSGTTNLNYDMDRCLLVRTGLHLVRRPANIRPPPNCLSNDISIETNKTHSFFAKYYIDLHTHIRAWKRHNMISH